MRISKSKFVAGIQCVRRLHFQAIAPKRLLQPGTAILSATNEIEPDSERTTCRGSRLRSQVTSISRSGRPGPPGVAHDSAIALYSRHRLLVQCQSRTLTLAEREDISRGIASDSSVLPSDKDKIGLPRWIHFDECAQRNRKESEDKFTKKAVPSELNAAMLCSASQPISWRTAVATVSSNDSVTNLGRVKDGDHYSRQEMVGLPGCCARHSLRQRDLHGAP